MDLLHTGSNEILNIETDSVILAIKGPDSNPLMNIVQKEDMAGLKVVCDEDYSLLLKKPVHLLTKGFLGRSYIGEYKLDPLFFEQQRYEIVIEGKNGRNVAFWHDSYNVRNKVSYVGKNKSLLTGVINFGNDIGLSDLVILIDDRTYLKVTIEVFPSKISYKEDYKAIVADVTSEIYNLAFDLLRKTYATFDISSTQQSSMVEFFAIIRKIYNELIAAADMIIRNPHHQLHTEHEVLPSHKIKRTDGNTVKWMEKHPEYLIRSDKGIKAEKALGVKKYVTYDTKENRLTKFMLEHTAQKLHQFRKMYCRLDREEDKEILRQIDSMISGIQRRCNTGFMKEVNATAARTGMSLVFGMAPGYREVYRCYLLLQHGLTLTGNVFDLSVKDLAVLYEYWCFIKLNSLMRKHYKLISTDIIRINGAGLYVSLVKGQPSTVRYLNPENGEIIELSYNPKEVNVPTVTQRPDNVLTLHKKGSDVEYEYIFDAKYRINPALPGSNYVDTTPGPEVGDINTMHRYRDAIVYKNGASPYERIMFGAYVLFPYNDEEEYKNHRFFRSIEQVNIGGLPFLPSATELVTAMLDELITDSPESAFERTILPRGIESKLAKVKWEIRDVLIGSITDRIQLQKFIDDEAYYIPRNRIKDDRLPIRYVALYKTKEKFGSMSGIEDYGEVISTHIVKQSDIEENSNDPDREYYYCRIKKWKKLSKPIKPGEIGFATEFTNLFLLQHSSNIPELLLKSEAEFRFYYELKRRIDAITINDEGNTSTFKFADTTVSFVNGEILLIKDNTIVNKCEIKDFARTPNAVFRSLMKAVNGDTTQ